MLSCRGDPPRLYPSALDGNEVTKFVQFFRQEVELYLLMSGTASVKLSVAEDQTPLRIASQASTASAFTGRQSWQSRTPMELFQDGVTP